MAKRYAFNIKSVVWQVREPTGPKANHAGDIFRDMRDIGGFAQEAFFVITLNNKGRMIDKYMVSLGTLTASLVHPREVFRPAIHDAAASVAFVHNHPSGNPEPSVHDRELTTRLRDAAKLLGFRVLDHVIIGEGMYYSFKEHGFLD